LADLQKRSERAEAEMLRLMRSALAIPESNPEPPKLLPWLKRKDRPVVKSD
jgi:hypothetical protein